MSTPWPPAAPSASASPGATRVLVVDDDPQVAAVLSSYLTGQGMEVVLADSAAGLRAALSQGVFHVVLLDLGLSDAHGYDALRELRARWSGALLIISGRGDAAERAISLELGADDFVTKPFDLRRRRRRIGQRELRRGCRQGHRLGDVKGGDGPDVRTVLLMDTCDAIG